MKNILAERLKGSVALALLLLGVLAISGGPDEVAIRAQDAAAAQVAPGGHGPYYTLDGY